MHNRCISINYVFTLTNLQLHAHNYERAHNYVLAIVSASKNEFVNKCTVQTYILTKLLELIYSNLRQKV